MGAGCWDCFCWRCWCTTSSGRTAFWPCGARGLKSKECKREKIAREDLGLAKDGEVIIKIPQERQPEQYSPAKP